MIDTNMIVASECIEIAQTVTAETLGIGIAIGIMGTLITLLAGRYVVLWVLKKWIDLNFSN